MTPRPTRHPRHGDAVRVRVMGREVEGFVDAEIWTPDGGELSCRTAADDRFLVRRSRLTWDRAGRCWREGL